MIGTSSTIGWVVASVHPAAMCQQQARSECVEACLPAQALIADLSIAGRR